ncbi:piggyBac transposable element-derived protein 4-like [Xyrichtys novacula]|uniref:PiggyBac transposable element-derived protein 4-like n=1 Tax=Xyrichtys novacula TaxID=13765 RepID=A0AAV1HME1_XYRNO|nr:piggyBac transposable element-derived protein 4-like [Xyrichtys novacula]
MEKKTFNTKRDIAEILAEIQRGSDVEFEDSSDSESSNDAGSEEEALFMSDVDPVYDHQEEESEAQAGPSGVFTPPTVPAAVTPPPPLSAREVSPLETSEEGKECEEYVPPQRRSSSSSNSGPSSPDPKRACSCGRVRGCGRGRGGQASKRPRPAPVHPEAQHERWHTKEEPDVEPPTPRFEPKHPPGPRIDTTVQWSPLSLFRLFFSISTINTRINNTNANTAQRLAQGAKYKWSPLSGDSFYLFLSIVLFFGLVRVHSRNDYWRKDWPYQFVFPKCSMTRDKFEAIFRSLHLSDVTEDEENERKRGTPQFDRLFKIKPLYGFRQYMRDKPTKFGYKLFVLADSKTGFTSNFQGYSGTAHCTGRISTLLQGISFLQTAGNRASSTHSPSSLPISCRCEVWQPSALTGNHARAHSVIERAFGMMKTRFRAIFLKALEIHHTFVPQVITACAVLHNICLGAGDTMAPEEDVRDGMPGDEVEDRLEAVSGAHWRDRLSAEVSALEEVDHDHDSQ